MTEVRRQEPLGPVYALDGPGHALQTFYTKARAMTRLKGGVWSPPTLIPLRDKLPTAQDTIQQLGEWAATSPLAALPDGTRTRKSKRKKGTYIKPGKRQRAAEWADGRAQENIQRQQEEEQRMELQYQKYLEDRRKEENQNQVAQREAALDDAIARAIPLPTIRGETFVPPHPSSAQTGCR